MKASQILETFEGVRSSPADFFRLRRDPHVAMLYNTMRASLVLAGLGQALGYASAPSRPCVATSTDVVPAGAAAVTEHLHLLDDLRVDAGSTWRGALAAPRDSERHRIAEQVVEAAPTQSRNLFWGTMLGSWSSRTLEKLNTNYC